MQAWGGGCEFYVHLNLVRSCETPSDPTRCPLPPWHPGTAAAGLSCWCGWCGSLRCTRNPCGSAGFRAACCSLLLVRLDACGLARYLFLFARIACGSALLLCTLASLAHVAPCCSDCLASCAALLVRCWFLACCFNASQSSGFLLLCQALRLCFFSAAGSCCCSALCRVSGH